MRCSDVENLVHPYLDGELVGEDCALLERHVAGCDACRSLLSFQARFKADLRAKLRARSVRLEPPAKLRDSVRAALDQADLRQRRRIFAPGRIAPAAVLLAAAAALVFALAPSSRADSELVEEAIRGHVKNLPVEVGGPTVSNDEIRSWMQGKVGVPVRPPLPLRAGASQVRPVLLGARVYHLNNRDVGQIVYRVGPSPMTVFVFDPSGVELTGPVKRTVGRHEVYLAEERGYTVALYRDRGVGYAFTTDLPERDLLRLVAASLAEDLEP